MKAAVGFNDAVACCESRRIFHFFLVFDDGRYGRMGQTFAASDCLYFNTFLVLIDDLRLRFYNKRSPLPLGRRSTSRTSCLCIPLYYIPLYVSRYIMSRRSMNRTSCRYTRYNMSSYMYPVKLHPVILCPEEQ